MKNLCSGSFPSLRFTVRTSKLVHRFFHGEKDDIMKHFPVIIAVLLVPFPVTQDPPTVPAGAE
jgi:hypothetical protein